MSLPSPSSPTIPAVHEFRIRPLELTDLACLGELAKHTYDGLDYIVEKLPRWLEFPELFICLGVEYIGVRRHVEDQSAASDHPSDQGIPLENLHTKQAPAEPHTYRDLPDGRKWTHERLSITTRPPAAAGGAVAGSPSGSPPPTSSEEDLAQFRGKIISIEVLALFDERSTGFLQALRVHPIFRGFGLSSLLHQRLMHLAEKVYHVTRIRETTSHSNGISLHLGKKHGLLPYARFDCGFYDPRSVDAVIEQIERQMKFLGMELEKDVDVNLQKGHVRRVDSKQMLDLIHSHPNDSGLALRICWMLYEPTESNLVYLCTEAVLPPGSQRTYSAFDPLRPGKLYCAAETPYFAVGDFPASPSAAAASPSSPPISAFALSLTSADNSGPFRAFSIAAPTPSSAADGNADTWRSPEYASVLRLFLYQLLAVRHKRHETAEWRCVDDPFGRIDSDCAFTTNPQPEQMKNVQSSTPCWFSSAYTKFQEHLYSLGDLQPRTSPGSSSTSSRRDPTNSPLAPPLTAVELARETSQVPTWTPECQMIALGKELVRAEQ